MHNACTSTSKAVIALGGTTVRSSFRLNQTGKLSILPNEMLYAYKNLFTGVQCIVIDEISMTSYDILHRVNRRFATDHLVLIIICFVDCL